MLVVMPGFIEPSDHCTPVLQRFAEAGYNCIDCEFAFGAGEWANYNGVDLLRQ